MVRVEAKEYSVVAVIVAGGSGRRMGGDVPKQYLPIENAPILAWSATAFQRVDIVDEIVLVVPEADLAYVADDVVGRFELDKVRRVVAGGGSRQDSTACGLAVLPDGNAAERTVVTVHDGVRPFVREETIREAATVAARDGAALVAVPATDTIKRVDEQGRAVETIPRDELWAAQTPQAFRLDLLQRAISTAVDDGIQGTDESMLVERLGIPVGIVNGDGENLKVTRPEDLERARAIAKTRTPPVRRT